jgi:DNA-binding transcriptional LysR family regulator
MNKNEWLSLSGADLRLFLTVLEAGSVTLAAERLGITQSAVSHGLARLRVIADDALFVKSGRAIMPTPQALALAGPAQEMLDGMQNFGHKKRFHPAEAKLSITVAGNDLQRDLLLPKVFEVISAQVASFNLRIIPSGTPTPEMLRERHCDFIIAPLPPEGADIVQRRLFEDSYKCFYDAGVRTAPRDFVDYMAARHVTVMHSEHEKLQFDKWMEGRGHRRNFAVSVTNFSGVPVFLQGTDLLASLPSLCASRIMRGFAAVPVPLPAGEREARLVMYLAWHRHNQQDPAHGWVRQVMSDVAAAVTRDAVSDKPDSNKR